MTLFDERDGMLMGATAIIRGKNVEIENLSDYARRLEQALGIEKDRNAKLGAEINELLTARAASIKAMTERMNKDHSEKEALKKQLAELQATVAELKEENRHWSIGYAVKNAESEGQSAQLKGFIADHPDSPRLALAEVPGYPELPQRSLNRITYNIAYSASLKEAGITLDDLNLISNDEYRPGHPLYLDRDPPVPEDKPSVPMP